jgi:hypothetical protein
MKAFSIKLKRRPMEKGAIEVEDEALRGNTQLSQRQEGKCVNESLRVSSCSSSAYGHCECMLGKESKIIKPPRIWRS